MSNLLFIRRLFSYSLYTIESSRGCQSPATDNRNISICLGVFHFSERHTISISRRLNVSQYLVYFLLCPTTVEVFATLTFFHFIEFFKRKRTFNERIF